MSEAIEWDFTTEPIIGHHVAARRKEQSSLSKELDRLYEKHDMARAFASERIEIKVSDVDWDETKSLTLRLETLESIVNQFDSRRSQESRESCETIANASLTRRTREEIDDKIKELIQYDDYTRGPRGDNLKYKHAGWISALRWVRGSDIGEEP